MTLRTCLALQMHARRERGTWAGMSVVCMSTIYEGMCMRFDLLSLKGDSVLWVLLCGWCHCCFVKGILAQAVKGRCPVPWEELPSIYRTVSTCTSVMLVAFSFPLYIHIYAVIIYIRLSQDFMAEKSGRGDDSDYSYVTDEEEEEPEAAGSGAPRVRRAAKAAPKPAAAKAGPERTAPVDAGPADVPEAVVTVSHGPPCATSKRRIPSPSTSSDDPGPKLPPRSRSPVRPVPALDARPVRDRRRDDEAGHARDRSTRPVSPPADLEAERDGPTRHGMDGGHGMAATRSKGKAKGKRTQDCPHCWTPVAWTPRGSGLSQHMWWIRESWDPRPCKTGSPSNLCMWIRCINSMPTA